MQLKPEAVSYTHLLGDGAVAVVTDPEDAAYNAGDRGQNYAWSAVGYGDWLYAVSYTHLL